MKFVISSVLFLSFAVANATVIKGPESDSFAEKAKVRVRCKSSLGTALGKVVNYDLEYVKDFGMYGDAQAMDSFVTTLDDHQLIIGIEPKRDFSEVPAGLNLQNPDVVALLPKRRQLSVSVKPLSGPLKDYVFSAEGDAYSWVNLFFRNNYDKAEVPTVNKSIKCRELR